MGYKVVDSTFRAEGSKETLTKESEWRKAGREEQDGGRLASLLNAALAAEMRLSYLAVHQGNYENTLYLFHCHLKKPISFSVIKLINHFSNLRILNETVVAKSPQISSLLKASWNLLDCDGFI